jgi:hypothetical protein
VHRMTPASHGWRTAAITVFLRSETSQLYFGAYSWLSSFG